MKFEFDTRTDTAKDAAALATALAVLYGPAITDAFDNAERVFAATSTDECAVDGHPVDTSAADAFGTDPAPNTTGGPSLLDKAGIPWDERIHSSTKGTNKDGTWSRRRNTPDATYDAVMSELRAASAPTGTYEEVMETLTERHVETVASAPLAPAEPVVPPPPPAPPVSPVPSPPATETPAAPNTSTQGASPTTADPITFPKLMVKITKAQTAQTIDADKVLEFLGMFGLSAVKELASAPAETIQAVNDLVDAHVGA